MSNSGRVGQEKQCLISKGELTASPSSNNFSLCDHRQITYLVAATQITYQSIQEEIIIFYKAFFVSQNLLSDEKCHCSGWKKQLPFLNIRASHQTKDHISRRCLRWPLVWYSFTSLRDLGFCPNIQFDWGKAQKCDDGSHIYYNHRFLGLVF